jgi:triacylglycerol esterase/lipase EstA (alpha/beta hydrolase family)
MKKGSLLRILRPDDPLEADLTGEKSVTASQRLARLLPDPDPIRQDLVGGQHMLAYVRHLMRGNKIRRPAVIENIDAENPPVLLLHGFLGTRGSMFMLEHRLSRDGICVFSFNLGSFNTRDIRASAFLIHRKIESVLSQTPVTKVDIVGHSMGGLIGLYYVKKLGGHEKVRKLIMMGTPQRGTWTALAGIATVGAWSASSWQLLPGSRFLEELHQGPLPSGVEYYSIAAQRDWVCPPSTTDLPGATALTVPLGHSSLVVSAEVYKRVIWALRR